MPTTLTVEISGMCLLVPSDSGTSLWVFMPKTSGTMHKHVPAIVYDASYVDPKQSGPVVATIEDELQHFTGTSGGDVWPGIKQMHGNQWKIHKKGPAPDWFAPTLTPPLKAKIEGRAWLEKVTDLVPGGIGADWDYAGQVVQLVTAVTCTMALPRNSVDIRLQGGGVLTLTAPGSTMSLRLLHVPADELPPHPSPDWSCPGKGKPPMHWQPYRDMLDITDGKKPLLHDDCPKAEELKARATEKRGINPYACMTIPGCKPGDPNCP